MTAVDVAADKILPLDGPHDMGAVITAAALVAELVRRLNHATRPRSVFDEPAEVDDVLANFAAVLDRMPQLLDQLRQHLTWYGEDPAVDTTRTGRSAQVVVEAACGNLFEAGQIIVRAADLVRRGQSFTSTLTMTAPDHQDEP